MFKGLLSTLFVLPGYKNMGTLHPDNETIFGKGKRVFIDPVNRIILTETEMENAKKRFIEEEKENRKHLAKFSPFYDPLIDR